MPQVIRLHPAAPPKPVEGAACNGCGLCCAAEPCPAGMLVSRRRRGACAALVWMADQSAYRCGLIVRPADRLPAPLRPAAPLLSRLARRWISASSGCDCSLEVVADAAASGQDDAGSPGAADHAAPPPAAGGHSASG